MFNAHAACDVIRLFSLLALRVGFSHIGNLCPSSQNYRNDYEEQSSIDNILSTQMAMTPC